MNFLDYKDRIVCASKIFNTDEMRKIYHLGVKVFGENYVHDLLSRKNELSDLTDIKWHFIGHLQSNKTKLIINEIDCLHSLDSIKLANLIQKLRLEPLDCYIQVNLALEDSKSGILLNDLEDFINEIKKYDKINLIGLMTIGVLNDDVKTDAIFKQLAELKEKYHLKSVSMGMSGDYQLALKYGSDVLRIGTLFKGVI